MSEYYTPTLYELRTAWVLYREFVPMDVAEREFDRTMDEFGNEQYEDGFTDGVDYGMDEED